MSAAATVETLLTFTSPPPGLAPLVDFDLRRIEGADGLFSLQSRENGALRMFVLDTSVYFSDYRPVVADEQLAALALDAAEQAKVFVVANPGQIDTTVNLMAPIVVNPATGSCSQIILEGSGWPVRAELSRC